MAETIQQKTEALKTLTPLATYKIDSGGVISWMDATQTEPSAAEITAQIALDEADKSAVAYKINRIRDYIDSGGRLDFMLLALWEHVVNADSTGTSSIENDYKTTVDLNNPAP